MPRRSCALERYAFSDQEVKQYFPRGRGAAGPVPRRRDALRRRASRPRQAPRVARGRALLRDARRAPAALVGQFYMDLYARDTKRGGAWMDDAITRRRKGAELQTPVAYLTCNFSRPGRAASRRSSRTTRC